MSRGVEVGSAEGFFNPLPVVPADPVVFYAVLLAEQVERCAIIEAVQYCTAICVEPIHRGMHSALALLLWHLDDELMSQTRCKSLYSSTLAFLFCSRLGWTIRSPRLVYFLLF